MLGQNQALLHRGNGDGDRAFLIVEKSLPAGQGFQFNTLFAKILHQRLAPTGRFGAYQHVAVELSQKPLEATGRVCGPTVHGDIRQGCRGAVN